MHNYNSTLALIIASEATSETEISVTDSQARVKAEASQSTDNGSGTDKSMDSSSQTSEAKNHESSFIAQARLLITTAIQLIEFLKTKKHILL